MKKTAAWILILTMLVSLCACGRKNEQAVGEELPAAQSTSTEAPVGDRGLIGAAMRDEGGHSGAALKSRLEAAGYTVELQYASGDTPAQISQIENMLSKGCAVLVIDPVDSAALSTVLSRAASAGIPVIACERLIMGSDAVTCYAGFDERLAGRMQGEYIEKTLDLPHAGGRSFRIEFVTGDSADRAAGLRFDGAMSVLQRYIDDGTLVCRSGQRPSLNADGSYDRAAIATPGADAARSRFEKILNAYYTDGAELDVVLTTDDAVARGAMDALAGADIGSRPLFTGQSCEEAILRELAAGEAAMSAFRDPRTLAAGILELIEALMQSKELPVNDTATWDNGTGIVPACLCEPTLCTAENYQELLTASGCYTPGADGQLVPAA